MTAQDDLRERVRALVKPEPCPTCGHANRLYTQADIARAVGVSKQFLSAFLAGGGLGYDNGVALERWLAERPVGAP